MKAPQLDMQYEQIGSVYTGWRNVCLEDTQMMIIDGDRGKNYPKQEEFRENGYCLFLSASNVTKAGFKFNSCIFISQEREQLLGKGRLQRNDLVLTTRGTVGNAAYYDSLVPYENIRINSGMVIIRNRDSQIDTRFVYLLLRSDVIQDQIKRIAFGSAQPQLTVATIKKLRIPLPPLPEQRKIAEILSTWDEAIDLTQQLIAAKLRRKQALMQRLLTGQVRFPGFEDEWESFKAGELFESISITNNDDDEQVLSVTQDRGVLPRDMLETRVVNPEGSTKGYKLIIPGNFIISLRSFQGGLEYSAYRGLVSPAYTVLQPKKKIINDFYRYYFKSYEFIGRLAIAVIGIRDGKQISYEDFCTLKLPCPTLQEQAAIADVLCTVDDEIALHQQKLAALRRQKQGLMQQLLTGRLRVAVDGGGG